MTKPVEVEGWTVRATPRATTLAPDGDTVMTFDLEGRPVSWFSGGAVYKRSLASAVHVRERRGGRRRRRVLSDDDAAAAFRRVHERVATAPLAGIPGPLRIRIEAILEWTPSKLGAERQRFHAVYRPVAILPPDQYLSIVLQATHGCSWNRCTYCNFYQDRPFRVREPGAFADHADGVRKLLGEGVSLRRGLFLADGNALVLSNDRLRPLLEVARDTFPGRTFDGFVDVFTGDRKTAADWAELRDLGLRRVHIGLETAHDPLLRWLGKPGDSTAARSLIEALKCAGLSVSLIVMCGAGGDRFAARHVADSTAFVASLPLGSGDVVYLSPFHHHDGSEYARRAAADGVHALDDSGREAQYLALRDGIRAGRPGPRIARYEIEEFLY